MFWSRNLTSTLLIVMDEKNMLLPYFAMLSLLSINTRTSFFQKKRRRYGPTDGLTDGQTLYDAMASKQGRIHGIRCVLARTNNSFGRKQHFCMVSTRV